MRVRERLARAFDEPASAFPILALAFGLPLLFLYPPFQAPDEHYHFFRAYEVSEGRFVSHFDESRNLVDLPRSLARLASGYMHLPFRPEQKTSASKILGDLELDLDAGDRGTIPGGSALYPPVAYLPHAVGIGLGRMLGLGPLWLFYLGRVFGLLFGVAGLTLALRLTGALGHPMMLIALLPMAITQMSAFTADTVLYVACFIMVALVLRAQFSTEKPVDRRWIAGFVAAAAAAAVIKPMYLAVALLVLALPPRRFGGASRLVGVFALASFVGWAAQRGWMSLVLTSNVASRVEAGTDRAVQQTSYLADHGARFLVLVVANLSRKGYWYLETFIGKPGWLDTPLPSFVVFGMLVALVVISLSEQTAERVPWKLRAAAVLAFAVITVTVSYAMYLYHTPGVGDNNIEGIQGRYFIPLAPLLAIALAGSPIRIDVSPQQRTRLVSVIAGIALAAMIVTMAQRYYG